MAAIQRVVSPLTKVVSYRAQIRVKGCSSESATFPNQKEAEAWAASIETAIREGRHFPHAAAERTSFDALAKDYAETVLVESDEVQCAARTLQLNWWSKQFAGKSVAEITADAVSKARDACGAETFTRGKPRKDKKAGEIVSPRKYRRSGATVNRYIATLSHLFSFAVKERRLIDRNPVGDIRREKEPRGRTRLLSDEERAALLAACVKPDWPPLHALVLLAITTGARRGELVSLKWADVDLKVGRATIHDTKNGEQRTLPLAGKALEALRQLKLQDSARSEYLFPSPTVVLDPETGSRSLIRTMSTSTRIVTPRSRRPESATFDSTTCATPWPRFSPRKAHRSSKSPTCSDTRRWSWRSATRTWSLITRRR